MNILIDFLKRFGVIKDNINVKKVGGIVTIGSAIIILASLILGAGLGVFGKTKDSVLEEVAEAILEKYGIQCEFSQEAKDDIIEKVKNPKSAH